MCARLTIKTFLMLLLFAASQAGHTQKRSDTSAFIKDFNKVMSFAVQPYLYYNSITSMRTSPLYKGADTGKVLRTTFFKANTDMYYGNEQEEIYLQDSLMVRINHMRKMIQLSKVDLRAKENMNVLPLKKMDMQKMLREQYTITELPVTGDSGKLIIRSREKNTPQGIQQQEVQLVYDRKNYLPGLLQVIMYRWQPETQPLLNMLAAQGIDGQKMLEQKNGQSFIVMSQTAAIQFTSINATKEQAMQMPVWTDKLSYSDSNGFSGKGTCEGYQVVKTF